MAIFVPLPRGMTASFSGVGIGEHLRYLFHVPGDTMARAVMPSTAQGLELLRILYHIGLPDDFLQGRSQCYHCWTYASPFLAQAAFSAGSNFPGLNTFIGVEGLFHLPHRGDVLRAEDQGHPLELFHTDAVLAADRPPHVGADLHDLRRPPCGPDPVHPCPAHRKGSGDGDSRRRRGRHWRWEGCTSCRFRPPCARVSGRSRSGNGAVVDQIVGTQPADGAEGALPAGPYLVRAPPRSWRRGLPGPCSSCRSPPPLGQAVHAVFQTVQFDEQDGRRIVRGTRHDRPPRRP